MRISFFVLSLTLAIASCTAQQSGSSTLPADAFEKAIQEGKAQILDVRTAEEFAKGHIKGSMQADWLDKSQFTDRVQHIDKNKPVYIYCASGPRSNAAARWMRSNGYKNVIELEGGYIGWRRGQKPVVASVVQQSMTLDEYRQSIPLSGTVLVDFGAEWCPPCVKMEPVLDEIATEKKGQFTLLKVDVGIHTNILESLQINSYPTFIVYKNGQETWRQTGIVEKAVLLAQLN